MQSGDSLCDQRAPPSRRYRSEYLRDQKLTTAAPKSLKIGLWEQYSVGKNTDRVVLDSVTEGHLPSEGAGVIKQFGSCKVGYKGNFV